VIDWIVDEARNLPRGGTLTMHASMAAQLHSTTIDHK
jgi:hypothetical protein